MKVFRWPVLLLPVLVSSTAARMSQAPARPRLAVVIVVDQMRADYLDRFASKFHGGFARLLREGAVFTEARHNHAGTETAPGHATLSTGTFPSHSGIIANNWYDRGEARVVYAVDDSSVSIAGRPGDAGRSPKRLLTEALGDWLKRSSPASKVVSVAIKDRAAILMGGKHPDAAYWYNTGNGRYQTSSYYTRTYPAWVDSFNVAQPANRHLAEGWTLLNGPETYSTPDSVAEEYDGVHVTFPHPLDTLSTGSAAKSYSELIYTPFGDELTLSFARQAILSEHLGADSVPDLLWVGCSAGDYVGHRYGPSSREAEDYYLRLDGYLGDFFSFLDQQIGAGNYVATLSADHGVIPFPEELSRNGLPARRLLRTATSADFQRVETSIIRGRHLPPPLLAGYLEGILLHYTGASRAGVQPAQLQQVFAGELRKLPYVADVFTATELASPPATPREFMPLFQHSFYAGRSPDLLIRFRPYVLFMDYSDVRQGTSHGTPYDYDRHVPLVFMGAGITAGRRADSVNTVDLAPTVASLLGIPAAGGIDGRALPGLR